jgi:hypothetical protein
MLKIGKFTHTCKLKTPLCGLQGVTVSSTNVQITKYKEEKANIPNNKPQPTCKYRYMQITPWKRGWPHHQAIKYK